MQNRTRVVQTGWRIFTTFDNLGDLRLVGVELERCQESQGAQVKGHNWWNALLQSESKERTGVSDHVKTHTHRYFIKSEAPLAEYLEERRRVKQSSIPTETDDEVYAVGDVIKI